MYYYICYCLCKIKQTIRVAKLPKLNSSLLNMKNNVVADSNWSVAYYFSCYVLNVVNAGNDQSTILEERLI